MDFKISEQQLQEVIRYIAESTTDQKAKQVIMVINILTNLPKIEDRKKENEVVQKKRGRPKAGKTEKLVDQNKENTKA